MARARRRASTSARAARPPSRAGKVSAAACGAWNSLVETLVRAAAAPGASGCGTIAVGRIATVGAAGAPGLARRPPRRRAVASGMAEVDRVLGGGLVPGSLLLLAGEPGIGKSTLVLQVAAASVAGSAAAAGSAGRSTAAPRSPARPSPVLYASAEESAAPAAPACQPPRPRRAGAAGDGALGPREHRRGGHHRGGHRGCGRRSSSSTPSRPWPLDELDGPAGLGGPGARVGRPARAPSRGRQGVPVLLVGHVTKDGSLAGPRSLEHLVDAVLMLEGDRYGSLRLLRALKNRHGSTEEVGVLEMTPDGLREVADTAAAFLGGGQRAAPGRRGGGRPGGQPAAARRGPGARRAGRPRTAPANGLGSRRQPARAAHRRAGASRRRRRQRTRCLRQPGRRPQRRRAGPRPAAGPGHRLLPARPCHRRRHPGLRRGLAAGRGPPGARTGAPAARGGAAGVPPCPGAGGLRRPPASRHTERARSEARGVPSGLELVPVATLREALEQALARRAVPLGRRSAKRASGSVPVPC